MTDRPNPPTWGAQLLIFWFRRNPAVFQDYLVNLINNLRGGRAKDLSAPQYVMVRSNTQATFDVPCDATSFGSANKSQLSSLQTFSTWTKNTLSKIIENTNHKMQFVMRVKRLHVSAPQRHHQAVYWNSFTLQIKYWSPSLISLKY